MQSRPYVVRKSCRICTGLCLRSGGCDLGRSVAQKVTIDIGRGDHVRFRAINRAGWGTYGIASVLGAGPIYFTFEREPLDPSDTNTRPAA